MNSEPNTSFANFKVPLSKYDIVDFLNFEAIFCREEIDFQWQKWVFYQRTECFF